MIYLFHSFDFVLFFAAVFALYWLLPKRFKNSLLLIASYTFYASWDWRFLGLILTSTYVDYFCGLRIHATDNPRKRKAYLLLSIITNLTLLGFFKYFNFFVENLISLLNAIGIHINLTTLNIILPIGISFYTFQTLSYTIDIYRKKFTPTKNIIDFSLFVAYFPQLIAGPIERARNLLPKIQADKLLKNIHYKEGLYLFVYGLFKKVVIADSVAAISDKVFAMANPSGAMILLGVYAFAVQIYCDFSGYSNMARGMSHFLGIPLSTNFNLPYLAKNPSDFWKRWHITLSSWARDYIYIPLGGKYARFLGLVPLFITMFLIGLWHGAAWHFVLWGVYWFAVTMIYRIMKRIFVIRTNNKALSVILTGISVIIMFHVTCYSWVIFRAQSLAQVISMTKSLFSGINIAELYKMSFVFLYAIMLFLIIYEILQYLKKDQLFIYKKSFYYQLAFYLVLFFMYVEIGAVSDVRFLYFQF